MRHPPLAAPIREGGGGTNASIKPACRACQPAAETIKERRGGGGGGRGAPLMAPAASRGWGVGRAGFGYSPPTAARTELNGIRRPLASERAASDAGRYAEAPDGPPPRRGAPPGPSPAEKRERDIKPGEGDEREKTCAREGGSGGDGKREMGREGTREIKGGRKREMGREGEKERWREGEYERWREGEIEMKGRKEMREGV